MPADESTSSEEEPDDDVDEEAEEGDEEDGEVQDDGRAKKKSVSPEKRACVDAHEPRRLCTPMSPASRNGAFSP
jgi:hypothetical protein